MAKGVRTNVFFSVVFLLFSFSCSFWRLLAFRLLEASVGFWLAAFPAGFSLLAFGAVVVVMVIVLVVVVVNVVVAGVESGGRSRSLY